MGDFDIKQGDLKPALVVTLLSPDGTTPVDTTSMASATLRVRRPGMRAHIVSAMSFLTPRANGRVQYDWALGDTDLVGEHQAVVVTVDGSGRQQTFPTNGYFILGVADNIEAVGADTEEKTKLPSSTPQTFGTGVWPWTPTIINASDVPVQSAEVRVITAAPTTLGPATTNASGQCIASDGKGSFRLDPGSYTVTTTYSGVTLTEKLTIDADGNGVLT